MKRTNYGYLPDYSSSNWTLRTQRTSNWVNKNYAPDDEKIPLSAWFGAALVVGCIVLALFL